MKKIILALIVTGSIIYIISCTKSYNSSGSYSCTGTPVSGDSTVLLAFAKTDSITPTMDTSGMYYQIITQGAGIRPVGKDKITVNYVGKFMNGQTFDSSLSPITIEVDSLILGWQYGLPKIQPGGQIKLLIPSALAYGCQGSGYIPPNTPVYFEVSLLNVVQ
jgi:FKBP-type peptidyl-prolyl cis-trans isomerase FkpA